jgi:hypothetical protein
MARPMTTAPDTAGEICISQRCFHCSTHTAAAREAIPFIGVDVDFRP